VIYLDNAATSWPKPEAVLAAMTDFLETAGGNPGRSGHRLSIAAGRILYDTREALAEFFNAPDPFRVVFTLNATHALNMAMRGLLATGNRVLTTGMEHNSVMRPLRQLQREGVQLVVIPCDDQGLVDMVAYEQALSAPTTMVVTTHASNVTGTIQPVEEMAQRAHEAGAVILVDAAQTAGVLPIDVQRQGIDLLAFTGHKGLQGPTGTGGLVLGASIPERKLAPLVRGGTGSRSEHEEQPERLPDRLESGTPNTVGLAGLKAGVDYVQKLTLDAIRKRELEVMRILQKGLANIPGVRLYGPTSVEARTGTLSLRIDGLTEDDVGLRLDEDFGVLTRVGLHCAPAAHRTLGTFPEGTVRLSAGLFTTPELAHATVAAVAQLVEDTA
jgi:cysteine desulfurase family protein